MQSELASDGRVENAINARGSHFSKAREELSERDITRSIRLSA
jgi:hypothetical protein